MTLATSQELVHFNPRSPHGERRSVNVRDDQLFLFQSTLPAWGATFGTNGFAMKIYNFNPRSPHGERRIVREF